jgi:hypothetical protein
MNRKKGEKERERERDGLVLSADAARLLTRGARDE